MTGSGIGKGIARMFAKAGAAVAITGRSASEVEATAAEIRKAGGRAVGLPVDSGDAARLPGPIETPALQQVFAARPEILGVAVNSTRLTRIGKPDEIGYGAVYLASEAAGFVTGAILPIHGGDIEELRQISPDL